MGRILAVLYGLVTYVMFLAAFLYGIGFIGNLLVPKGIDAGANEGLGFSLLIDVVLLALFAVQHSVMARQGFKAWWTRIVPAQAERSTYVLLTSAVLALLFWQWRPLTGEVWTVSQPSGALVLQALGWAGWVIVLLSTFMIDHFDLFGLRQVWLYASGHRYTEVPFRTVGLYRLVRHPLMLGLIVAFWAAPAMTVGHLLFAFALTAYIFVGVTLEERDLIAGLGEPYRAYRQRVGMLLPRLPGR